MLSLTTLQGNQKKSSNRIMSDCDTNVQSLMSKEFLTPSRKER